MESTEALLPPQRRHNGVLKIFGATAVAAIMLALTASTWAPMISTFAQPSTSMEAPNIIAKSYRALRSWGAHSRTQNPQGAPTHASADNMIVGGAATQVVKEAAFQVLGTQLHVLTHLCDDHRLFNLCFFDFNV